ncbi:discoidin domain-containing protein [Kibdelosporangium philippinense]|uniref:Discoidin domain-containing protein n=1 Tax=Kibdelosporangium philippinense TaxID=211113 RepID=A0ABS8ZNY3_9PSEU|nr:discoidin domain-containing protein [Kibdelosporangium philippinense]MCE7009264.1 discoidin domain-containing protein [Kibdelosporangium philippinense]
MTRSRLSATFIAASLALAGLSTPAVAAPSSDITSISDGDQNSYWQSGGAPAQIDLGQATSISGVVLKLPAKWEARAQHLSVQGSYDGVGYFTIASAKDYKFEPRENNTVQIPFGATVTRYVRVDFAGTNGALAEVETTPAILAGPNLALGKTLTASGSVGGYGPGNANDSNQTTYWESTNNAFPQWLQVDLGASISTTQIVVKLPVANWGARTQTLTVRGSANGTTFADLVASAAYQFNPTTNNTVTINYTATTQRYLRLHFTGNTGWPAGQVSEFEVYGPEGGDTQPPTAPANLRYTQPGSGQINLQWNAATDNVGVTGYDVYANNVLRTSVTGLSYTDNQPDSATVTYFVRAKDAAGNQSPNSNSVTRVGQGNGGTNLAVGTPITASSTVHTFVATNANDNDVNTYWEGAGGSYPNTLTVQLGANADTSSVVVRLNPAAIWGPRTQTIEVLGREQSASALTSLVPATTYSFDPATGNSVTIPVTARAADVQLKFTANSGAPAGQAAEFQVIGVAAPNPDLTVTASSWSPSSPVETDTITTSATVRNAGAVASGATDLNFYLGTNKVGTAQVAGLAAGAQATVTATIGAQTAGSYQLIAKVDESNKVIEQSEANNTFTNASSLVVSPVASSDLIASPVSWTPDNPSAGNSVSFAVAIKNQGTIASASGAHNVTLQVANADTGVVVANLSGVHNGVIAAGATTAPVALGTWTAANGRYTIKTVIANDGNELPVKQGNNTTTQSLFVGRGANMPYDHYEAETGVLAGGAAVVGPNRTIGDLAGEASGRRAVTLNSTGASVEFTNRQATNTLVTRFSIPDAPGGGGINSTLDIFVNGTFHKAINLTSRYSWLYGNEASPGNSPGAGPRHIYDEASVLLNSTVPAGSKIRLQKSASNTSTYAIDFVDFEQVSETPNPDPAKFTVPTGFGHQDVQNALDRVRMDTTGNLVGVYLPKGDYQTGSKFQVYGKPVQVVGAGPWFSRFLAPANQEGTDIGFRIEAAAGASKFSGFAYFGNYVNRIDGPGKVFDANGVTGLTIDNVWTEHMVCLFWGANVQNISITNSRIRNMWADGVNMTNGSKNNRLSNIDARSTGDDSFALFAATDAGGSGQSGNVYENLSSTTTWRAAGLAVYGGQNNTFRNLYIADTLTYSGLTISSLDFGYPMEGFGPGITSFQNISLVRAGGHFWGAQTFGAIWMFSASKVYRGIRVSDVDIVDPTYSGIMFQTNYVGGQPQNPMTDSVLTNISISGARLSGDQFEAKSGFGLWANEMPEPGQGPAVGSVTFNNLRFSNNHQDIKNTTNTFTININ